MLFWIVLVSVLWLLPLLYVIQIDRSVIFQSIGENEIKIYFWISTEFTRLRLHLLLRQRVEPSHKVAVACRREKYYG